MLSLANCGSIQDKCVEQLCANMASTSLTLLNLSRCKGLTGTRQPQFRLSLSPPSMRLNFFASRAT
jgi:hypothetical protein